MDLAEQYISPFLYVGNKPIVYLEHDGNVGGPGKQSAPNDPIERLKIEVNFVQNAINKFVDLNMSVWGVNQAVQTGKTAEQVVTMSIEHGMPDMISLYAFAEKAYPIAIYHEIGDNWITNGTQASLIPYSNYTGGLGAGWGTAGVGFGLRLGWSLEEIPTMASFYGNGAIVAAGGFGLSGDFGLSFNNDSEVTWFTASKGIGLSVPGVGGYAAITVTTPLGDNPFENK